MFYYHRRGNWMPQEAWFPRESHHLLPRWSRYHQPFTNPSVIILCYCLSGDYLNNCINDAFYRVETTRAPRSLDKPKFNSETVLSSIDEAYYDSYKFFRQIAAIAGRQGSGNMVTISSDGCSGPVDFSKFLSCIGLTVQNTDTATSWFTTTTTITSGYSTVFLAGCTPPFFPYPLCTPAAPVWAGSFWKRNGLLYTFVWNVYKGPI